MSLNKVLNSDAFWQYSIATYQQPEVKEMCLHCQAQYDLNVNVILLCGWLNRFGKTLEVEQLDMLLAGIADSQAALKQLRCLRNGCLKGSDAYKAYLREELEYEAQQQKHLINTLASFSLSKAEIHALSVYFEFAQCGDKGCLASLISKMEVFTEGREDDCNIRL